MGMETDRISEENGKRDHRGASVTSGFEEANSTPFRAGLAAEHEDAVRRADDPMPGPGLLLDERLTSAAAPFLYMLAIILIAVAGYFVYIFLSG